MLRPRESTPEALSASAGVWPMIPLAAKGKQLLEAIKAHQVSHDSPGLSEYLQRAGWNESALIALLTCCDDTVVRASAWCLAQVGTMRSNLPLAAVLHRDDASSAAVADNALWGIWLRPESHGVRQRLCRAIRLAEQDDYVRALAELDWIIQTQPDFAEAHNQRGMVKFLTADYCGAVRDYRMAARLNPVHFGALAGIGHCFAALGRYNDALRAYRKALAINPRLQAVRQAIGQIKRLLGHPGLSGSFPAVSA